MDWAEDVIGGLAIPSRLTHLLKRIIACITAFIFGLFIGYVTGYFYYGGEMDLTDASTLGALGTWFGSIATAFTFAFLIWQNTKIRQQQKATEDRQQQFEDQQQALWDTQQVKIQFEMYQAHKKEFFSVLDGIEKSSKVEIEFYNREKLYRRIFPINSFSNVIVEIEIDDSITHVTDDFRNLNTEYSSTVEELEALVYFQSSRVTPLKYLHSLLRLTSLLNLIIKPSGRLGELVFEDKVLINVFHLTETINIFNIVFKGISEFTGNHEIKSTFNIDSCFYMSAMQKTIFSLSQEKNIYQVNLDEHCHVISLYHIFKLFERSDIRLFEDYDVIYRELHEYMTDSVKIKTLIKNSEQLNIFAINLTNSIKKLEKANKIPQSECHELAFIYEHLESLKISIMDLETGKPIDVF